MKKFFKDNKKEALFILCLITTWRLFLFLPYFLEGVLSQRSGFIGPIPFANFDGVHYLSIAENGYFQYEQAFFPLFPLAIRIFSFITFGNYLWAGILVVHIALFLWIFLFYRLLKLDYSDSTIQWILVFTLFFPTAFYFGAVYTETLFLFFVIGAFLAARKKQWILAGVFAGFASATKLVGVFLLFALLFEFFLVNNSWKYIQKKLLYLSAMSMLSISGLLLYMFYLWQQYKDPLFFIHAQVAFGANRTGGAIILLPQVLYRYIKIFMTVPFTNYDVWIALLEFFMFVCCLVLLIYGVWKKHIRFSYIIFSLLAIVGPTLTGTLSSMPRYVLAAFPIFIVFGSIKNMKWRVLLLIVSISLMVVLCTYFLRGYFIS
jgi:Gpi18-like mannosyltransferase